MPNNNYLKYLFTLIFAFICNMAVYATINLSTQLELGKSILNLKENGTNCLELNKTYFDIQALAIKNFVFVNKTWGLNPNDNSKPIDNVKIFPNPVSTQIIISFSLKKDSKVSIKILDILGKDVATLLDQKLTQGEQTNTFIINSKIPTGFYFIRIVSGNDSIIKRISVI